MCLVSSDELPYVLQFGSVIYFFSFHRFPKSQLDEMPRVGLESVVEFGILEGNFYSHKFFRFYPALSLSSRAGQQIVYVFHRNCEALTETEVSTESFLLFLLMAKNSLFSRISRVG